MPPTTGTILLQSDTQSRVPDIARLQRLQKSAARFTKLLTKVRKRIRRVHNFEFQIQERRPRGTQTTVNHGGGYLSTDTSLVVADASFMVAGDTLVIPRTGEQIYCNEVDQNTNTLDVQRAAGTSGDGAHAINNGDYIIRTGNTAAEAYTVKNSWVTEVTRGTNFVETVTTPIEWSDHTILEWSYYSDEQRQNRIDADREDKAIEHLKDVNRRLLLGRKGMGLDSDNKTLYFMNGLWYSIDALYDHSGGQPITETQFTQDIVEPVFINASDTVQKWALCSRKALTEAERMGRDRLRINDKMTGALGFTVTSYMNGAGTIELIHEPNFDESTYHAEAMTVTDLDYVQFVLMKDMEHRQDLEVAKTDVQLEEWRTRCSLEVTFQEVMINARDLRTAA